MSSWTLVLSDPPEPPRTPARPAAVICVSVTEMTVTPSTSTEIVLPRIDSTTLCVSPVAIVWAAVPSVVDAPATNLWSCHAAADLLHRTWYIVLADVLCRPTMPTRMVAGDPALAKKKSAETS